MADYQSVPIPLGLYQICEMAEKFANEIKQLDTADSVPLRGGFVMIRNHLILTLEILTWYYSMWGNGNQGIPLTELRQDVEFITSESPECAKQENAERVMVTLKALFISSMSSIEFSAKAAINSNSAHQLTQRLTSLHRRIYLSDIVAQTQSLGIIDEATKDEWQDLIFIRNCLVHNNGISDKTGMLSIEEMKLPAQKSQMLQGKLDTFAFLTQASLKLYRRWAGAFIATA